MSTGSVFPYYLSLSSLAKKLMSCFRLVFKQNGVHPTCVFWSFDSLSWSAKGCKVTDNSQTDVVVCECNHLTNFAILMVSILAKLSITMHKPRLKHPTQSSVKIGW